MRYYQTLWRRTMHLTTICLLTVMFGVFGAQTESNETLSVMVGDSLTLYTDIKAFKRNDHIVWMFGPDSPDTLIAEIIKWSYMLSIDVRGPVGFRERLQLDHHNGSLTVRNIGLEYSGLYKLTITNNRRNISRKSFSVQVYAPLPVPVVTGVWNSSGSYRCVLMCSVTNATRATLSFYRGSDLLSRISSGSAFNSSLALPLEVKGRDERMYSCVVSNPFSNRTALAYTSELCRTAPGKPVLYSLVLLLLIPVALIVILCVYRRNRKQEHSDENC